MPRTCPHRLLHLILWPASRCRAGSDSLLICTSLVSGWHGQVSAVAILTPLTSRSLPCSGDGGVHDRARLRVTPQVGRLTDLNEPSRSGIAAYRLRPR